MQSSSLTSRKKNWRLKQSPLVNELVSYGYIMKLPYTPFKKRDLGTFLLGEPVETWREFGVLGQAL